MITLELLYTVGRRLGTPLAALFAEEDAPTATRSKTVARVARLLVQQPERDVADVLVIVERIRDIKARARRH